MRRKTIAKIVPIALVVVFAVAFVTSNQYGTHTDATTVNFPTIEDISKAGDVIVIGQVKEVRPSYSVEVNKENDVKWVLTDVVLSVERELTGNYDGKEIVVTTFGGEVPAIINDNAERLQASGNVDTEKIRTEGKKVMLVLEKASPDGPLAGKYLVTGGSQGIFEYQDDKVVNSKYFPEGELEENAVSRMQSARETN